MKFKHIITFLLFSLTLSGCQISKLYTVTWENYDGTVLEVDSVAYGLTPTYDGATPSKGGSAQYAYTFSGWSPDVSTVTGDATYIAQFSSAINSYTITWENYDGTVLETDSVAYGLTPTYDGATPSKDGSAQYAYTFSGWSPDVSTVTGDATYIAQFSSAINSYTITWENYDGTVLETDSVAYGSTPTYDGATPSKDGTDQYTYTFSGWSPDVSTVTGDATYIAQFSSAINSYTITWENYDGTVLETDSVAYGSTPTYDGATPSKGGSAQYTYTFSGWSPSVVAVTSDATYIAQFSSAINSYTITWENYDGTVLETDSVAYGSTPTYDGATPSKGGSAQYTYTFSGWSPSVVAVTSDATYIAQFSSAVNSYTITWQNYSGSVLETDINVPYGTTPSYNGVTPTRVTDAQYSYVFSGWSPTITTVTGNQTYVAQFDTAYARRQFGTYPQSKVTDTILLNTLNSAGGTLPTSSNSQAWTDYGYYISGSILSYMWYIDVANATDEYRGVYFTSYRPYFTTNTSSTSNSVQDDNGYTTSSVYWFKYEPITWRVLDVQSNRAFLMADLVLDSQDYHYSTSNRTIGGSTVYANNYKESHIRSWLNDNFYNTAFTTEEKARIQTTNVDNSVASTGYSSNTYVCANTSDQVFLLSYAEATSATYGLSTDASRQLQSTPYAKSQGISINTSNGNSFWWLRSPYSSGAGSARDVNGSGNVYSNNVNLTIDGVVPALWISL